jgi:hypothetical protein
VILLSPAVSLARQPDMVGDAAKVLVARQQPSESSFFAASGRPDGMRQINPSGKISLFPKGKSPL